MEVVATAEAGDVVGVDVGGTTLKGVRLARSGEVRDTLTWPTPTGGDADAVLAAIDRVAVELGAGSGAGRNAVVAVGVAVPGIVDEARGIAVVAANLGWRDTPVRDELGRQLGLPVVLGHDVRAAGYAEWRSGAASGVDDALVVTLGTGIGAAVVTDGRLLVGAGYAGQLGHVRAVAGEGAVACGCGARGCLATVASASAVARRYAERSRVDDAEPVDAAEVAARARAGDEVAALVWAEAVEALGCVLTAAVTLFGSEVVVLGGGLALAGDQLLEPVERALVERLTFQRRPAVRAAALGDRAGSLGAALLAADRS